MLQTHMFSQFIEHSSNYKNIPEFTNLCNSIDNSKKQDYQKLLKSKRFVRVSYHKYHVNANFSF